MDRKQLEHLSHHPLVAPPRNVAVGMARAHHLGRGGCNLRCHCWLCTCAVHFWCCCGGTRRCCAPDRSALMCQGNQAVRLPVTVRWLKTTPMLVAQRYAGYEKGDFDDAHHHDSRIACLCHGGLLDGHASWARQMREEVPRGNDRAANGSTEATPGGCLGSQPALLRAVRSGQDNCRPELIKPGSTGPNHLRITSQKLDCSSALKASSSAFARRARAASREARFRPSTFCGSNESPNFTGLWTLPSQYGFFM
jgi:hypothetical protein